MAELTVEVAYAVSQRQRLVRVVLQPGATVGDAIAESRIADEFPDDDLAAMPAGVWGRVVPRDHVLADGDRVEVYRPLAIDPKEARRRRAASGDIRTGSRGTKAPGSVPGRGESR